MRTANRPVPIVQNARKPKVPVIAAPIASLPGEIRVDVNRSMKARRELAWSIVQKVWTLGGRPDAQLPAWMTWYEPEDLEPLFRQVLADPRPSTPADVASRVSAVMASNDKDLQTSLSAARLGKTLRQFTFPEFRRLVAHAKPGTGNIFYNPAYVAHLLTNAERIAGYDSAAFRRSTSTIATTPAQTPQPAGAPPANAYALSMDREMPPDALMIKVEWVPVERGAVPYAVDGRGLAAGFKESRTGQFDVVTFGGSDLRPFTYKIATPEYPSGAARLIVVSDDAGKRWALMGMHIASKVRRTWLWTTFMWQSPGLHTWDADKPAFFEDTHDRQPWYGWPLHQYGMAVASDFSEGDPAPWAAFERVPEASHIGPNTNLQEMSTSLKDLAAAMNGLQWCANPYIEVGMSHTNCIGCHQGSPTEFMATTLTKARNTNVGDFSFSIATNREMFRRVLRERR